MRQPDPDLRRDLVQHTARSSLRTNLLSIGLIAAVVVLLRGAPIGAWLWVWAAYASVCLLAFDQGIRWCLRHGALGQWSRREATVFAACFAVSGSAWGTVGLLPLGGEANATHQSVVGGVVMMAIAASLVFGSATNVAFGWFHGLVSVLAVVGFTLDGNGGLAVLLAFAALAVLPVRGELAGHIVGATVLARQNQALVEELRRERAEVELANLRLSEANVELSRRATRDPLTGLANRDLFAEHLAAALARRRRDGRDVSVIYLDLDHFKQVNDTYGHAAGDELLQGVATRVGERLRETDLLSRQGGDEFAVVAVTDSMLEAVDLAERICQCFAEPFTVAGHPVDVGTSVGLATARGEETAEELVRMADAALYRAKRQGRNQMQAWRPASLR